MNYTEVPAIVDCEGESLLTIASVPGGGTADAVSDVGLVVIVGGPQYRIGSHRQFVLLARWVAGNGYAAIRFDQRGMGDSTGQRIAFDDTAADIGAALQALRRACPQVKRFVLWGLCDGASAALVYWRRSRDPAIAGMVLTNPWVGSERAHARVRLSFYYLNRIRQREFWRKLFSGRVQGLRAVRELSGNIAKAAGSNGPDEEAQNWQHDMAQALKDFPGPLMLILSGNDHTAQEFREWMRMTQPGLLDRANVTQEELPEADHTFSTPQWRNFVEQRTLALLAGLARQQ